MLFKRKIHPLPILDEKVVLVLGGSGLLGRAFAAAAPRGVFIINVSRSGLLVGDKVVNYPYDLTQNLEPLFAHLSKLTHRVDSMVTMAYSKEFRSVEHFNKTIFLEEISLDVAIPVEASRLCGESFWRSPVTELQDRKVIHVSSLAGFGKTLRPELATYSAAKSALNSITPYIHDYIRGKYKASAHLVAPGSLENKMVLDETVETLWRLAMTPMEDMSVVKIG